MKQPLVELAQGQKLFKHARVGGQKAQVRGFVRADPAQILSFHGAGFAHKLGNVKKIHRTVTFRSA